MRKLSSQGDKLVDKITLELIKPLPSRQRGVLHSFLRSNEFLATFHKPFKFKFVDSGTSKWRREEIEGDKVKAYIKFIEINYGYQTAKRYFIKNIEKYYNSLPN